MVILHGLIKTFKLEVYLFIVLFSLLLLRYTLFMGLCYRIFRIWHEGRDVSDILAFCGAGGVTLWIWFKRGLAHIPCRPQLAKMCSSFGPTAPGISAPWHSSEGKGCLSSDPCASYNKHVLLSWKLGRESKTGHDEELYLNWLRSSNMGHSSAYNGARA
jgi:hypothetical protein